MAPSAKRIVLELLTAAHPNESPVAQLVRACEVVGVDDNNVRVVLARLVAAGTVEPSGRGVYRLGRAARPLTEQVLSWRELDKQVRRWDGGWAFVQLAHLPRSDRAALRRRERALRLLGFRELERGLAVRPDNLVGGVAALRDRLVALGVDEQAIVTRASDLDIATEARARRLWDAERLTQSYRHTAERIERWLVAAADLSPRVAAREAFWFGGDVLRKIMYDPRLPEPLVDVAARRALVDAARRLDVAGRRIWAGLFGLAPSVMEDTRHAS
ncbi:MAG TPA: PaaX family transcriptional regulator C-terminal domain-containing protein [Kofleriaceae bacterium]|nr:PaaX family transcriptional regulator C-terminal domain-containing protein [Kofleriaceae bacterium]